MLFMRHGQSEFNVVFDATGRDPNLPDAALSELGRQQVQKAAENLKDKGITRIISSPYTRALQTASATASLLGLKIHVEPLVGERRVYSCDIGSPASLLKKEWPDVDFSLLTEEKWWIPPKESQADVERRARHFSQQWKERAGSSGLLVVSHWFFIGALTGRDMANAEVIRV